MSHKRDHRWCRGEEGVEHVDEIVKEVWAGRTCRWIWWGENQRTWVCHHTRCCAHFGKHVSALRWDECPANPLT